MYYSCFDFIQSSEFTCYQGKLLGMSKLDCSVVFKKIDVALTFCDSFEINSNAGFLQLCSFKQEAVDACI